MKFLILSLPRSRSAWLANFLNHGSIVCHHELSARCKTVDEIVEAYNASENVGNADSNIFPHLEELYKRIPDLRIVTVRRDLNQVIESLKGASGIDSEELPKMLRNMEEEMDKADIYHGGLRIEFDWLNNHLEILKLWAYCCGDTPFPEERFNALKDVNIQINPEKLTRYANIHAFWRDEKLTEKEHELLSLVQKAHASSALRGNASSDAVFVSSKCSGDFTKSLTAALMTIGGLHAPLSQTYDFLMLDNPASSVAERLEKDMLIAGWGNSFHKGKPDELWNDVAEWLNNNAPELWRKICAVTDELKSHGKDLHPNPSTFTAATAIILGMPKRIAAYIFIAGRLQTWADIYLKNT